MYFTDSHEWVEVEGKKAKVGITKIASKELETIERIIFPKVGQMVKKGEEILILESTKAASDSYAPLSGTILSLNPDIQKKPSSLHLDPEGTGWLYEMEMNEMRELEDLFDQKQYDAFLKVSL